MDRYLRQDIAYFDTVGESSPSVQVTTTANLVNQGIAEKLGLTVQGISTFVSAFAVAFAVQWKLTLITVCITPVILIVTTVCAGIDVKNEEIILAIYSKAGVLAEEVFASMKTVHAFWGAPRLSEKYQAYLDAAKKEGMKKSPNYCVLFSAEFFCVYAGYGLAFWRGVRMYASGEVTESGDVFTYAILLFLAQDW